MKKLIARFCRWRARAATKRGSSALFVRVATTGGDAYRSLWLAERAMTEFESAREWEDLAKRIEAL